MIKRLFLLIVLIGIASNGYAANFYGATALTGGTTGALDAIDITGAGSPNANNLAEGDGAMVVIISGTTPTNYFYVFDADGTTAESSPSVIRPDDYSDGGVWRLANITAGAITTGEVVSEITTEYKVWEVKDSNGDVVASCVVTCSVITDGSQVCEIKYYVMSDTAGSLTNEFSINVDSDE